MKLSEISEIIPWKNDIVYFIEKIIRNIKVWFKKKTGLKEILTRTLKI